MVDQVFFTHVMKTGGTSISRILSDTFAQGSVYPPADAGIDPIVAKTFTNPLVARPPAELASTRLFSVHQPAWVADAVAPAALRITVLREPVARTISHLRQLARTEGTDDLGAIYDDDGWRSRLVDHQCQMFGSTADDPGPGPALDPARLDDAVRAELRRAMRQFWETGVSRPLTIDRIHCDAAIARLERYDIVGVTDDLPGFARAIADRTGLDLPAVPHMNAAQRALAATPELVARIEYDTRYDRELYQRARELAGLDG